MPIRDTRRPTCYLCHGRESQTFCITHKIYCCPGCAIYHDDPRKCVWEAAVCLALLRKKEQLSFGFAESEIATNAETKAESRLFK